MEGLLGQTRSIYHYSQSIWITMYNFHNHNIHEISFLCFTEEHKLYLINRTDDSEYCQHCNPPFHEGHDMISSQCSQCTSVEFGQNFIITFSIKSLSKWIPGLLKSHSPPHSVSPVFDNSTGEKDPNITWYSMDKWLNSTLPGQNISFSSRLLLNEAKVVQCSLQEQHWLRKQHTRLQTNSECGGGRVFSFPLSN